MVDSHYLPLEFIMQEEIWKDVKGYEGLYQVSSHGRVKSLDFLGKNGRLYSSAIKKQCIGNHGYFCVTLTKEGNKKPKLVHRLLAIAFIPNPKNKPYVNHIDESRDNNSLENLEWCTHKENINHGTAMERSRLKRVKKIYQYTLDKKLIKIWDSVTEASMTLGYSKGNLSNACLGRVKTSYGFIWSY